MTTFDLRALRQQSACGIAVSIADNNRRSREGETNNNNNTEESQQQQDLSKLIPETLQSSIKENGGDPTNVVLRFRFDNILNYKEKVFEILKLVCSSISAPTDLKTFTLDLERCAVTDAILGEFFNFFEKDEENNKKVILTHLFLAGNLITAKGLQTLLHVPDKNPPLTTEVGKNLQHLGITANPLGGHGLEVLSEYLEINPITNKLKILHATRIAWASQSSFAALRAAASASAEENDSSSPSSGNNNNTTVLPPPVAKPPGMITVYEAERFANAVKNATALATVYFKQNAVQAAVDDEIPWPKAVILEDQK